MMLTFDNKLLAVVLMSNQSLINSYKIASTVKGAVKTRDPTSSNHTGL